MASAKDRHCPHCNLLLPKATRPRNKNKTEQAVETPQALIDSLSRHFNYVIDLAATNENAKFEYYFSPEEDTFKQNWAAATEDGPGWLNPEFGYMKPWAEKCRMEMEREAWVTMLAQASVGSKWYRDYVQGVAQVWNLYPRVQFVGHDIVFPKDLILCVYQKGIVPSVKAYNWVTGEFTYNGG